jgi:hypothetical protein
MNESGSRAQQMVFHESIPILSFRTHPVMSDDGKHSVNIGHGGYPEEQSPEEEIIYQGGLKLVVIIVALALALFLVALDQTIIATAIPRITDHFNSVSDIGWYGSAYFLTTTSLQATFGRIYKTFSVIYVFT